MALAEVAELKSPVKSWVPSKKQLLIGGKWVDAKSGKTFDVENPATGDIVAQVADGRKEDIDEAVKAARKAFESGPWKEMSASERGKLVWKIGLRRVVSVWAVGRRMWCCKGVCVCSLFWIVNNPAVCPR